MSYSLTLRFIARPFPTEGDALAYATNLVRRLTCDSTLIKRQLENERWYLDNVLEQADVKRTELRTSFARIAIRKAVSDIFSIRMVYWPKFQLAALIKDTLPDELTDDLRDVVFQDGTDQDYEFNDWSNDIPLFARLKEEVLEMPTEAVVKKSRFSPNDTDIDYARRSLLYQNIFNTLDLDTWLYGLESEHFKRATLSGITYAELELNITTLARVMLA